MKPFIIQFPLVLSSRPS